VATRIDGREECVEGAEVSLIGGSLGQAALQTTDAFGDFRFDGLEADSGTYRLRIVFNGRETVTAPIELKESVNAGVIRV
jgi:hypothetical protein